MHRRQFKVRPLGCQVKLQPIRIEPRGNNRESEIISHSVEHKFLQSLPKENKKQYRCDDIKDCLKEYKIGNKVLVILNSSEYQAWLCKAPDLIHESGTTPRSVFLDFITAEGLIIQAAAELMTKNNRRNWRRLLAGGFIAIIVLALLIATIILLTVNRDTKTSQASTASSITLEQWLNGWVSTKSFNGTWLSGFFQFEMNKNKTNCLNV
ncbi:hypothetical protein PV326_014068 [Microctonus aethiopoides]|nr:hypothetical protein PV326_014068 [Microctonus aethiopoides]